MDLKNDKRTSKIDEIPKINFRKGKGKEIE